MIPKLRFKADDGSEYPAWEEKTLGECCVYGKERGKGGNYVGTDNMLQDFAGVRFSDDVEAAGIAYKTGDVLMSNIRPYLKKVWSADRDGVCSTDVLVFHPTNIESGYLHYRLASDSFISYVMSAAKGSKMPRGDKSHIMEMELLRPCADEQRKIAALLSSVDDVITAQAAEVAAWEERKKGVMQKLFSQEVRFKADDGSEYPAWAELAFADTFVGLNNNTFSRDCLNYGDGPAKNIHYGDVLVKYGACVDVRNADVPFVNDDTAWGKYDKLQDGDVVIADTAEDDTVGKAVEVEGVGDLNAVAGLHTIACRPRREFSRHFLGYYLNSDAFHNQLRPFMQGIKVTSISKTNIALTSVIIPSLPEQCKIADCLSALDEVIAKARDELAKWQELKKGLLQQMFV